MIQLALANVRGVLKPGHPLPTEAGGILFLKPGEWESKIVELIWDILRPSKSVSGQCKFGAVLAGRDSGCERLTIEVKDASWKFQVFTGAHGVSYYEEMDGRPLATVANALSPRELYQWVKDVAENLKNVEGEAAF